MQIKNLLSHFKVILPSIYEFQYDNPPTSIPLPPFANNITFTIYLKFLFVPDNLPII